MPNIGRMFLNSRAPAAARRMTPGLGCAALALAPLLAWAQPHVKEDRSYVLRASTVSAQSLPEAMRNQHGIPSGDGHAVLNVTVQQRSGEGVRNVPAQVEVKAHNLMGIPTGVDMRQVMADGMVSYLGVYQFLPREVLTFQVMARPEGMDTPIELTFQDRLGRR